MKTAISVDDLLLSQADSAAKSMCISRSKLVSIALERFLRERRNEELLQRLNDAYPDAQPEEKTSAAKMKRKFRKTIKDAW